jgi:hypothetical protein
VIIADASTFFSAPLEDGCSYEYSVVPTDGLTQSNLIVDSTGAITLENHADETISYDYSVQVTNIGSKSPFSDSWNAYSSEAGTYTLNTADVSTSTLAITGFTISTQCGPSSTTVSVTASPLAGK